MDLITAAAVVAAIFTNGATDAPGNIAGAVSSGSISYRRACAICAVFNFIGMAVPSLFLPAVAESTIELVPPGGGAVPAALLAVVVFSGVSAFFGIPTSESHGLMAALCGCSLYINGSVGHGFMEAALKGVASCLWGLGGGALLSIVAAERLGRMSDRRTAVVQGACAAMDSLCHGMQDGQKFLALLWVGTCTSPTPLSVVLCSAVMAFGALAGGRRIALRLADTVGMGSVGQAVAADVAGIVGNLTSSLLGAPISTTYMKGCAMMGASLGGGRSPGGKNVLSLTFTWIITYPVCMALAYVMCLGWDAIFK